MKYSIIILAALCFPIFSCGQNSSVEAVDLGLSVKWANVNLGASRPGEYGDYFAWGEVKPKAEYSWETYKWCAGSETTITKYSTDNRTVLAPEDDAATVNLGGKWRMPTAEEIVELTTTRKNPNYKWTWKSVNGHNGWEVVYLVNGKSVFFPAAGYRDGTSLYDAGSLGGYLSSSLYAGSPSSADNVVFDSGDVGWSYGDRYGGLPVRPVCGEFVHVKGITLSKTEVILLQGASVLLTATLNPEDAFEKGFVWQTSDATVASVNNKGIVRSVSPGVAAITATSADGGYMATCTITVPDQIPIPEAVDLGLSVKWASFNLGASSPEEFGAYYAWGETEPKDDYYWSTYKWCMDGDDHQLTNYCTKSNYGYNGFTDNKTVLDPEDDAAAVNWGGSWRMPTYDEFDELKTQCTWTWTTLNGVYGRKVTSNKSGYTDKWIFLPAAGYRLGTSLRDAGSFGYYWSSSLYAGNPSYAYLVYFLSGNVNWNDYTRYFGQSVRPVSE